MMTSPFKNVCNQHVTKCLLINVGASPTTPVVGYLALMQHFIYTGEYFR